MQGRTGSAEVNSLITALNATEPPGSARRPIRLNRDDLELNGGYLENLG